MPTLIAVHEIIRRDADKKRQVIAPGAAFSASEAEAEFYLGCGAARQGKAEQAPTGEKEAAKPRKAAAKKADDAGETEDDSVI